MAKKIKIIKEEKARVREIIEKKDEKEREDVLKFPHDSPDVFAEGFDDVSGVSSSAPVILGGGSAAQRLESRAEDAVKSGREGTGDKGTEREFKYTTQVSDARGGSSKDEGGYALAEDLKSGVLSSRQLGGMAMPVQQSPLAEDRQFQQAQRRMHEDTEESRTYEEGFRGDMGKKKKRDHWV